MDLTTAYNVLRFAARKANATEAAPLRLGNVFLWMDGDNLVYDPATHKWDRPAFNAALESFLTPYAAELAAIVHPKPAAESRRKERSMLALFFFFAFGFLPPHISPRPVGPSPVFPVHITSRTF